MLVDTSGVKVALSNLSNRGRSTKVDVAIVRRAFALLLDFKNVKDTDACQILGVCRNTYRKMVDPTKSRKAPEVMGVVFGRGDWTPADQDQDPATCDRCHGVKRGSRLYCAACHSTGFERELENERIDDIFAEASEAEAESRDKKAKRRTRKLK